MNIDTILYTSQFLPIKDKMALASTCTSLYKCSKYIYKDELVKVSDTNLEWVRKYTPKLIVTMLKHVHLNNICELSLRNIRLVTWPECISSLSPSLRILDLSYNSLKQLPESIDELKQLRILKLVENKLTQIPDSICDLVWLEYLDISRNELTYIPENIGNLTRLTVLHLHRNRLTRLPESIYNLSHIEELYVYANHLPDPLSISDCMTEWLESLFDFDQMVIWYKTDVPYLLGYDSSELESESDTDDTDDTDIE